MGTSIETLLAASGFTKRASIERIIATVKVTEESAVRLEKATKIPAGLWKWMTMADDDFDNHIAEQLVEEVFCRSDLGFD